eukprot:m.294531 g.294531  ORF g.294531 m.294531 type:complete len:75 (+) comp240941_c0_seq1:3-227(+)
MKTAVKACASSQLYTNTCRKREGNKQCSVFNHGKTKSEINGKTLNICKNINIGEENATILSPPKKPKTRKYDNK